MIEPQSGRQTMRGSEVHVTWDPRPCWRDIFKKIFILIDISVSKLSDLPREWWVAAIFHMRAGEESTLKWPTMTIKVLNNKYNKRLLIINFPIPFKGNTSTEVTLTPHNSTYDHSTLYSYDITTWCTR